MAFDINPFLLLDISDYVATSKGPAKPGEMIASLSRAGFREHDIRAAMWALIDERKLEMTNEWKLIQPDGQE